ncbi:MAG: Mut7-C RNAse domain-containing protein [Thaumarchaeota archaeon]|nr:Mut7-C RNAse domain-containing protein [Nitrososphaerota archaeon]
MSRTLKRRDSGLTIQNFPGAPDLDADPRFVVDAMLGSFARKLRILGLDASYYRLGGDQGIIEVARRERRVILTADRSLAETARARHIPAVLVRGPSDGRRLSSVLLAAGPLGLRITRGVPLCSLCGGGLQVVGRAEVVGRVPPRVFARHRKFFRCSGCGRHYWKGSHWKKLRSFGSRLPSKEG